MPATVELALGVITMQGHEFVLCRTGEGDLSFPHDHFQPGETPAAAARRVVEAWTGTTDPKLEIVDFRSETDGARLRFVFRAMVTDDPQATSAVKEFERFPRGGLPESVGWISGAAAEEALKSSLNYKLTRG